MKKWQALSPLVAFLLLVGITSSVAAQDSRYPTIDNAKARFTTLPVKNVPAQQTKAPTAVLPSWNNTFQDFNKTTIRYTMVGTSPSKTNTSTTVPVFIVPVKLVYGATNGNMTFDPVADTVSNGKTVINNILASPLFDPGVNFTQGGTDLGTTQYLDAYQRGNFWRFVSQPAHSNYHVLLQPVILPEQTINVTKTQGFVANNPFGSGLIGTFDIGTFDTLLNRYILTLTQINPGGIPLFITHNIYLTQGGGCCVGGYHTSRGSQPAGQTYGTATYVDSPGAFSQDVSAISHELGEWMDDPFVNNFVECFDNGLMENGDPLEGRANFGGFPYTLNGFTYNLQSLVFIGYFGAPRVNSVHKWLAFQNDQLIICPH